MRRAVGLPLLGVGCFMLLIGAHLYNKQRQSLSWPSTTGTVESARIAVTQCDKSSSRSPVILYMYTVAGVEYRSDRVRFAAGSCGGDARETVDLYHAGATIRVFYDPQDPSEAVLEPGVSGGLAYVLAPIGLLVCLASIAVMAGWLPLTFGVVFDHGRRELRFGNTTLPFQDIEVHVLRYHQKERGPEGDLPYIELVYWVYCRAGKERVDLKEFTSQTDAEQYAEKIRARIAGD